MSILFAFLSMVSLASHKSFYTYFQMTRSGTTDCFLVCSLFFFMNTLVPYKPNSPADPVPSDMPQHLLHHKHHILSMGSFKPGPAHIVHRSHGIDCFLNTAIVSSVLLDWVNTASNTASLMPNFSSNACPCHSVFHSLIFEGPQPAITKCH